MNLYKTRRGSVQFLLDRPLPAYLIAKPMKAHLRTNEGINTGDSGEEIMRITFTNRRFMLSYNQSDLRTGTIRGDRTLELSLNVTESDHFSSTNTLDC